jgi:hypothetical protein
MKLFFCRRSGAAAPSSTETFMSAGIAGFMYWVRRALATSARRRPRRARRSAPTRCCARLASAAFAGGSSAPRVNVYMMRA